MGGDVSGMVNANLVLPAPEAGCRPGQFTSFSCVQPLAPPAPNSMAAMTKSSLDVYLIIILITYQQIQHALTKKFYRYTNLVFINQYMNI